MGISSSASLCATRFDTGRGADPSGGSSPPAGSPAPTSCVVLHRCEFCFWKAASNWERHVRCTRGETKMPPIVKVQSIDLHRHVLWQRTMMLAQIRQCNVKGIWHRLVRQFCPARTGSACCPSVTLWGAEQQNLVELVSSVGVRVTLNQVLLHSP